MYEETGLNVEIGDPLLVDEWHPIVRGEQWQIVGIYFVCTTKDTNVVLSQDHDEYQWINPNRHTEYQLISNAPFEKFLKKQHI